ncbi:MAG: cytochrome c oxidase subunit 3 [Acidimicrobiales bacterium]|nr:cytochrome c oxidase subunit 3 [Acidimicrobiales bacterium]
MSATIAEPAQVPLHLGDVPQAPPRRPRVLLIGTAFAAAASVAVFVGLFAVYFSVRSQVVADGTAWLPGGATIPLAPGNMTMVTLAMSLVTVQWAVHAAANRDRGHAYTALGVTILFGLAHITQIAFLFTEWQLPLNGDAVTTQAVLLFTILGLQIAMTGAALIFLGLMAVRSLGGQFTGPDAEGLSAAALYWYVTVAVYSVIWYSILIVK